ncbi:MULTISPECIES: low temperature requirement protein A [Pseudomonadota]|uniref:low temperature requirement protein A n=1 Tax=Pseudomonadota TaxID=1224 RepID=UPI001CA63408|nr:MULTISPECIES: low temperature requirement protein A [Pseudomonadota]MBY8964598.1 low temperature requirement protein A [Algiphilus acroporae]MCI5069569.1 low temperature requirement protein A [Acidovorax sp.]MCI5103256.1 low temperature requirement protein A [Algiphilus sp.]
MSQSAFPIWRKPRHYMDDEGASDHVHWVELFFDLIHVVTIFLLGNFLSHHLDWQGFWVFTGLFLAIFYAWADCSVYNSLYISTDMTHRAVMAVQIVTMMVIAAAIPSVMGGGWAYFAFGYALNRALTAYLYWRARSVGAEGSPLAHEQARNFFILAAVFAVFAVSAFLAKPMAYWVFGTGVVMIQLQYMLPRIGTLRFERFVPRLGHIAERFGLLMLILLGEGFFKLVLTLADKGVYKVGAGTLFNLMMGGLSLFALAWIYFDGAGNARPRSRSNGVMLSYWLAHIAILWAAVMVGVALAGEVYVGLWENYPTGYGAIGTVGLATFLGALWVLQRLVEGREITNRYHTGPVRAFGIGMALLLLVLHPHVPALIGNMIWGLAIFSQVAVPLYWAVRDMRGGVVG